MDGEGLKRLTVSSFRMPPKLPSVFQMKLFVSASSFVPELYERYAEALEPDEEEGR